MKNLITALKYLAMLAIGIFLFWLAWPGEEFLDKILKEVSNIHYSFIILAFFAAVLSHWSRGARWNLLIRPLGYNVSGFNSFMAVVIGYFANLALPRMGEISRCVVLNRTDRIPVDKLIGTVIVERIIDLLSLLLITAITFAIEFERLKEFFSGNIVKMQEQNEIMTRIFSFTGFLVIFSFFIISALLGIYLYRRYRDLPFIVKIKNLFKGFSEGLRSVGRMDKLGLFILHSIFIWLMYYLMVYLCFKALGVTSHLGLTVALTVLVTGSFGFVVPVQGGIGAYHMAVSQTLQLYGLDKDPAFTFAFVAHTFQMIVFIVLGALSFLYLTINYRKYRPNESPSPDQAEAL